jgi:hypothetical protein
MEDAGSLLPAIVSTNLQQITPEIIISMNNAVRTTPFFMKGTSRIAA